MAPGTMRYVHPVDGWFADVPALASSFFSTRDVRMTIAAEERAPSRRDGVELHGVVLKRTHDWVLVSCGGLFASGPCDEASRLAVGKDAHVYIS